MQICIIYTHDIETPHQKRMANHLQPFAIVYRHGASAELLPPLHSLDFLSVRKLWLNRLTLQTRLSGEFGRQLQLNGFIEAHTHTHACSYTYVHVEEWLPLMRLQLEIS